MGWKRKIGGGFWAFIGFMLSPLSWWNDAFVNIPLAVAFAWVVARFYRPAFEPAAYVGYWLTNVLGFVLMHRGAEQMLGQEQKKGLRREIVKDLTISLLYTLLIMLLIHLGVLKPLDAYFKG
jgi:hypothetical protein